MQYFQHIENFTSNKETDILQYRFLYLNWLSRTILCFYFWVKRQGLLLSLHWNADFKRSMVFNKYNILYCWQKNIELLSYWNCIIFDIVARLWYIISNLPDKNSFVVTNQRCLKLRGYARGGFFGQCLENRLL